MCVYIHTFFVSVFVAIDLYYTYPRALTCHFLTSFDALNLGLPELFFLSMVGPMASSHEERTHCIVQSCSCVYINIDLHIYIYNSIYT